MRFLRATHHLNTSSVILHGLHSLPYTTKYTHTSTYFIIQNTFFRWFFLSETTLRYFHFLHFFSGERDKFYEFRFVVVFCRRFFVLLLLLLMRLCHFNLSMYVLFSLCHSIAISFKHSMNAIHTLHYMYVMYIKCETSMFAVCVTVNQVALWCQNTFS